MPAKKEKVTYLQVNLTTCHYADLRLLIKHAMEEELDRGMYGTGAASRGQLATLADLANALGAHEEIELTEAD